MGQFLQRVHRRFGNIAEMFPASIDKFFQSVLVLRIFAEAEHGPQFSGVAADLPVRHPADIQQLHIQPDGISRIFPVFKQI